MSNFAYSQIKISEYLSCYFAILSICSAGIATEMNYQWNDDGSKEDWIKTMTIIGNVSTVPLSKFKYEVIMILVISVIVNRYLYVRWMRTKLLYSELDTIFNT